MRIFSLLVKDSREVTVTGNDTVSPFQVKSIHLDIKLHLLSLPRPGILTWTVGRRGGGLKLGLENNCESVKFVPMVVRDHIS